MGVERDLGLELFPLGLISAHALGDLAKNLGLEAIVLHLLHQLLGVGRDLVALVEKVIQAARVGAQLFLCVGA
ncbi:hypothetical protein D3C80_2172650 [compost metagenome]